MRSVHGVLLPVLACLAFFLACDETQDISVTNVLGPETAIIGRVVPASSGITVSAWQAEIRGSAIADTAGFFSIRGLAPGIYELRVVTMLGLTRRISNVEVEGGKTVSVGDILLNSAIYPVLSVFPSDGTTDASAFTLPFFTSAERVTALSLQSDVVLSPTTVGSWVESDRFGDFTYRFEPAVQLATSTVYTIAISPSLTFASGDSLGSSISYSFTTSDFRITRTIWNTRDTLSLPSSFRGRLITYEYSSRLDSTTIQGAISITPAVDWSLEINGSASFTIRINSGLVSGVSYSIVIDNIALRDVLGATTNTAESTVFATRAFTVESRSFPSTQNQVEPRTRFELIRFRFNVPLDVASIPSAVTISPPLNINARASFNGSSTLIVHANEELKPGTAYTLIISSSLAAIDGATLGAADTVVLQVQPLKLLHSGLASFSSSSPTDTVVDAERAFNFRVYFNATVDADSFGVAAALDHSITGVWLNSIASSFIDPYVWFFSIPGAVTLEPSDVYLLTVDGSVGLVGSASLGANETHRLITEQIQVTSVSPVNGSSGQSQFTRTEIDFNSPMNRPATEAAFSMQTFSGTPVAGTFSWNSGNRLRFNPLSLLALNEVYVITVDTTASSPGGVKLPTAVKSVFGTRP